MVTKAETEKTVNYEATAKLANEAFASTDAVFRPEYLRWLYERSFSLGATVIALRNEDRKVGQIALLRQTVQVNGRHESAAQLVDLFVIPGYRGQPQLRQLYAEVEKQFIEQDIRFAIGMPNAKAQSINEHFFELKTCITLPLSVGVSLFGPMPRELFSAAFNGSDRGQTISLFSRYLNHPEDDGLVWDEGRLFERLAGPKHEYGVHALDEVLLISSPRRSRGINFVLLCGIWNRPGSLVGSPALSAVVRSACAMWRRPLFAYVGVNKKVQTIPGIALPLGIRPSPMLVQLRDFKPDRPPLKFDRYQPLDFDFA